MEEDAECPCPGNHKGHICVLRCKGMTGMLERKTVRSNVACSECGEKADSEDDVCFPVPLFI